jgi:hypothetical protein
MFTAEERALLTDISDKLLDLYAKRDEAVQDGDLDRLHELQIEIEETRGQRQELVHILEAADADS